MKKVISLSFCLTFLVRLFSQDGALKIEGHHLTDLSGKLVWILADTEWDLFMEFSVTGADALLSIRKRQGFNLVQVMVTGVFPESDSFRTIPFKPPAGAWIGGDMVVVLR